MHLFFLPTEFCEMEPDKGDGKSSKIFLYYNAQEDRCVPFTYSGEGGNANRFENERECIRNCSEKADDTYPMQGKMTLLTHDA